MSDTTPASQDGRHLDILALAIFGCLLAFVWRLPILLLVTGSVLWALSRFGYIWKESSHGEIPAALLLISAGYATYWLAYCWKEYLSTKKVLTELALRSMRPSRRDYGDDECQALSRYSGVPVQSVAKGEFTRTDRPGEQTCYLETYAATTSHGLLLWVTWRMYLIEWEQIELLTPMNSEAEITLTPGPLGGERIRIPWSPDMIELVPARLRAGFLSQS